MLEAPVVRSVSAVESGTLAVLVAGNPADQESARPVLERLGEVHYVGPDLASAPRLKLVANSMLGIVSAAAAELLAAGTASGLAREQVFRALAPFAPVLKAREAEFLHDRHQPAMFAVRDLLKDLDLALEVYSQAQLQAPLTLGSRELFADTMAQAADLDISAIVRRWLASILIEFRHADYDRCSRIASAWSPQGRDCRSSYESRRSRRICAAVSKCPGKCPAVISAQAFAKHALGIGRSA